MPICIYCLEELGREHFNKEHVIPQQLGRFRDNQTLIHAVCSSCNSYFSDTLENVFGRDSFEAIFRLRHGQKSPSTFKGFAGDRMQFRIPAGTPGEGVIVTPAASPDGREIGLMLPPQVGVQRDGEVAYRYYTEDELRRNGRDILPPGTKAKFRLLAANDDEAGLERVKALLQSLVPKFRVEGDLDLPPPEKIGNQIIVEVRGLIDTLIARMVAKIGFNYMAKHAGAHFARKRCFDPVRRFIRYGEGGNDWRAFVRILSEPLLAEETRDLRVTQGHVVLLGWRDARTLQARVSPYNSLAYEVTLTGSYDGVWMPLKVGHVFDWEHGVVHKLQAASGLILLPSAAQRAAKAYAEIVGRRNRTEFEG